MGLSTDSTQGKPWSPAHYGPRRHDAPGKIEISKTTPRMEVHGQVGGTERTREELENEWIGGPTIQDFENDTPGQQGFNKGKGDQDYRRCQAQSKQPLGQ